MLFHIVSLNLIAYQGECCSILDSLIISCQFHDVRESFCFNSMQGTNIQVTFIAILDLPAARMPHICFPGVFNPTNLTLLKPDTPAGVLHTQQA